jgi:hypothetical protein
MPKVRTPLEKFNDFDVQVILYSKGWYEETNPMDDIRKLLAKFSWTPIACIPDSDVLQQTADTMHKIWAVKPPTSQDMDCLYKDIWLEAFWKKKETITQADHLAAILRVIHSKDITHYPELPCPNPDNLPTDKVKRWKELHEDYDETLARLTSKNSQ